MTWFTEPLYGRFVLFTMIFAGFVVGFIVGFARGMRERPKPRREPSPITNLEEGMIVTLTNGVRLRIVSATQPERPEHE